jgi:DNA-binding Lrp family transcriptional regulator
MRVLAMEIDGPISVADSARRSGLTVPGARKAIARLESAGVLQTTGGGRNTLYELRFDNPLVAAIVRLFDVESERFNELLDELRRKSSALEVPHQSVWIESFPKSLGETMRIGVLAKSHSVNRAVNELGHALVSVEQKYEITIEVKGYTRADLAESAPSVSELLAGIPPIAGGPVNPVGVGSSRRHGNQAQVLGRSVASLVRKDSSLIRRAREHVERLLAGSPGTAEGDLNEWLQILKTYSPYRLGRFLTSTSERSLQLLQSNPFLPVLTDVEKKTLMTKCGRSSDESAT